MRVIRRHWPLAILLLIFNISLGSVLLWNWRQLKFGAYDLGIHDQVLYLYSRGIFASSSFTHFPAPFWDSHFRPTFIIFFLQYLILASPQVFIVLQVLIFTLGVIPIYLLVVERLSSKFLASALAFAYLFYPGALSALAFPGHSEILVATLVSWALFFYLQGKKKKFFLFYLLAAISQENISLYLSGLSFFLFVKKDRRLALFCFLITATFGSVVIKYLIPWRLGQGYVPSERYFDDFTGLAPLLAYPREKVRTVVLSLLNFAFLPLGEPLLLMAPAISLAVRFLSVRNDLWGLLYHYSVFLTPFLAYSSLLSLCWLRQKWPMLKTKKALVMISLALIFLPCWINIRLHYFEENFIRFHRLSKADLERIHDLLAKIPDNASVSAQTRLIPLLTHRQKIYSLHEYQLAKYIPIDLSLDFAPLMTKDGVLVTRILLDSPDYQILECSDYSLLLKKGPRVESSKGCQEFRENLERLI